MAEADDRPREDADVTERPDLVASATPTVSPADEPISILLVDDEPKNLTVLETVLAKPGYRLVRAESADQALLALVGEEFALIVLDIRMPDMTGFELADLIKRRKKSAGIPIIFLTAYYNEDQHMLDGYKTGAVDYLHKPVSPTILRSKVAVFAELHRKTRECVISNRALQDNVAELRLADERLRKLNNELERRVADRTTELYRTHSALRESEERLAAIVESSGDAIFSYLPLDGVVQSWNAGAERLFGYTKEQAVGHPIFPLLVPAELAIEMSRTHERVQGGEHIDPLDTVLLHRDGRLVQTSLTISPVKNAEGKFIFVSAICRDIAERKRMENELRQYAAELSEADRRKSEFLAVLAHELRNPLAPIRNIMQVLRRTGYDVETVRSASDVLERQFGQMVRLVDDLLDVSRINRGKVELRKARIELSDAVSLAVEAAAPLLELMNHKLTVTLPESPIYVNGDRSRLAQVVGNLLSNACKFTDPGGSIRLVVEIEGDQVAIRVRDSGIGIASDQLSRIFEMFVQLDTSLERSQSGLGIGLTLVHSLVALHDGTVEVHSAGLGHGSEFLVRLPIMAETLDEASEPVVSQPAAVNTCRILLVDDNRDSVTSLARLLELIGHETHTAYDGLEAVEAAEAIRPDVILLDIGLPKLNGYEVARRIREQPWGQGIVLVALTGWGQDADKQKSREAGFDAHFVKPVDHADLMKLLAQRARRRER